MSDRQIDKLLDRAAEHTRAGRAALRRGEKVDALRFARRAQLVLETIHSARLCQAVSHMSLRPGSSRPAVVRDRIGMAFPRAA